MGSIKKPHERLESKPYSKGTDSDSDDFIETKIRVYRYSVTSDHKPVFMKFSLEGITGPLVALTYNMSFASDLGRATGSERNFVQRAIDANPSNPRAYWKNAANLVADFVNTKNPAIMYFQEMNDREMIDDTNVGGYQALLKLLAQNSTYELSSKVLYNPTGSYYTTGTYVGTNSKKYGFVAYSIKKTESYGDIYPTVLTIWNTTILGDFSSFYGNDLGLHASYNDPYHYGRNFSCVTTSRGANLINLHGPNAPAYVNTKLIKAIEDYMKEAATNIGSWNEALTVIGGDTNDTDDKMKEIKFEDTNDTDDKMKEIQFGDTNDTDDAMKIINYGSTIYNYADSAPLSCCAEYFNEYVYYYDIIVNDTLNKPYRSSGDKIFVKNPNFKAPIYKNQLFKPSQGVAYGGRRRFNNLKQRKTIKKKHYNLKKKKSLKKRRSFRRKTTKHTH